VYYNFVIIHAPVRGLKMEKILHTSKAIQVLGLTTSKVFENQLKELDTVGYTSFYYSRDEWLAKGIDIDYLAQKIDALLKEEGADGGKESNQYLTSGPERGRKAKKGERVEPNANRLSNLLNKDLSFLKLAMLSEILICSQHVIGDEMRLSSLDMREPLKGCGNQELHTDVPDETKKIPTHQVQCVSFLYLDNSNEDSGPLRIIPASHRKPFHKKMMDDLKQPHVEEKFVIVPKGTLVIANASLWHSGTNKLNDDRRRVIFINYRNRKLRPQLNQRSFVSRSKIKLMNEAQKYLLAVDEFSITDGLKFWVYYNRNEWYVKLLLKMKQYLRKLI